MFGLPSGGITDGRVCESGRRRRAMAGAEVAAPVLLFLVTPFGVPKSRMFRQMTSMYAKRVNSL
jgi:hypothetical protein